MCSARFMHSIFILALVSVTWVLFGFTLAFGSDAVSFTLPNGLHVSGLIGGLDYIGLRGVGVKPLTQYAPTIPGSAYMAFQMMFAVITPALITGAFAERKRFKAFVLFSLLWTLLVYSPIAHWVWGEGGWLRNLGAIDFAGGTVVHISSGVAALGRRSRARSTGEARVGSVRTPRRPPDRDRRGPAVVRLVRLQRRVGPGGERPRGQTPSWSRTQRPVWRPSPGSP